MRDWIKREARLTALALAIALPLTVAATMVLWVLDMWP